MALMRYMTRVGPDGSVTIPSNLLRETAFKQGDPVELKLQGPSRGQYVVIRKSARVRKRQVREGHMKKQGRKETRRAKGGASAFSACKARVRSMPQTGGSDYLKVHTLLQSKERLDSYLDALDSSSCKARDELAMIGKELGECGIPLPEDHVVGEQNCEPGATSRRAGRKAGSPAGRTGWSVEK